MAADLEALRQLRLQKMEEAPEPQGQANPNAGVGYIQNFLESAGWSALGLLGYDPPPAVQAWQRDNPVGGVVSDFVGIPVPYLGYLKAAKRVQKFDNFVEQIGASRSLPAKRALQETVRFAPFEVGRVGLGTALGNDPGELAASAATDLAIGAGLGAGLGGLQAYGRSRTPLHEIVPGMELDAVPTLKARTISKALEEGKIGRDYLKQVQAALKSLRQTVRLEVPGPQKKYVESQSEFGGNLRDLNRLLTTGNSEKTNLIRRRFVASSSDFADEKSWRQVFEGTGLKESDLDFMQFPRHISFANRTGSNAARSSARTIQQSIRRTMEPIGDGWWWAKEGNEGLYVMAKKAKGGNAAGASDEWVVFKTDEPGRFFPQKAKWAESVVRRNAWIYGEDAKFENVGNTIWDAMNERMQAIPLVNYLGLSSRGTSPNKVREALLNASGLKGLTAADKSQALKTAGRFAKEYLAPRMFQFGANPRANWVYTQLRGAFDDADRIAEELLAGKHALSKSGELWKDLFRGATPKGGLLQMIDTLDEADLSTLSKILKDGKGIADLADYGASEKLGEFLKRLDAVDEYQIDQMNKLYSAIGEDTPKMLKNHFMLSRTWRGNWRQPVYNEKKQLIYVAGGKTRKEAQDTADSVIAKAAEDGKTWITKDAQLSDRTLDLSWAKRVNIDSADYLLARQADQVVAGNPGFLDTRQGVGGYIEEFSKQELKEILSSHVRTLQRDFAQKAVAHRLKDQFNRLMAEDPGLAKQLIARYNDLAGKPGPIAASINEVSDKLLGPALGKNSATKVARTFNTLLYNFQLGALNINFPIMNALTFMQTSFPQMAFIMGAAPERVARYYTHWPVAGADGRAKGHVGALSALKLGREAFRQLGRPSPEIRAAVDRAVADGVVDPRMIEDYLGDNARKAGSLRSVLKGEDGVVDWLRSVSEFMPAQSEKFARTHAFITGHIMGKDLLNLSDEALYRFAKEFTNNTMFLYGTADRARVMTGPVGAVFGLFKNWQTHYMWWMGEYTGELFRGNPRPFLWMTGSTAAIGGLAAAPLFSVADSMSKWLSDESLMTQVYGNLGGTDEEGFHLADAVYLGLPAALPELAGLPGFSLSQQAATPFNSPVRDASMLFSFVHWDRMKALGRAVGGAVDSYHATGDNPMGNPTVRDQFARALAPKTVYRSLQAFNDKGITSMTTGYPLIKDVSSSESLMYAMGMNPRRVELNFRVAEELWNEQSKMRDRVSLYGEAWAQAIDQGRSDDLTEIMNRAFADGVDVSSVIKSANTRLYKLREDQINRQFDAAAAAGYRQLGLL